MKRFILYFKSRRESEKMAKLFIANSNPNFLKIKDCLDSEEQKMRLSVLREEIFDILYEHQRDISNRYKTWEVDFHSCSKGEFSRISNRSHQAICSSDFEPILENNMDEGNLFPGVMFESPYCLTPQMSSERIIFNALGILMLSGKYNPIDQIILRVVGIQNSTASILFKIIRIFDPSNYKDDLILDFSAPKRKRVLIPSY